MDVSQATKKKLCNNEPHKRQKSDRLIPMKITHEVGRDNRKKKKEKKSRHYIQIVENAKTRRYTTSDGDGRNKSMSPNN